MPDWNWFFSSLAQSAAAIVGLLGAFVISKIISNESIFSQRTARLVGLTQAGQRLRDRCSARYFRWYNLESKSKDLERLWGLLKKDSPNYKTAAEYYETVGFSPFISRSEVLSEIEERLDLQPGPELDPTDRSYLELSIRAARAPLEAQLSRDLQTERETIDALIVEVRAHAREVAAFVREIESNPESSPLISYAIAAVVTIFFAAVVYPLSFLPASGEPKLAYGASHFLRQVLSLRGILLIALSTTFTVLMGLFFKANRGLRYPADDLVTLREWSSLGSYSPYLAVLETNERQAEEGTQGS